jgi:uncharacterized protein (TIGR02001 family)
MKKSIALRSQCSLGAFVLALSVTPCWSADDKPPPPFTGHIDLVSKYILRGVSTTYGNAKPGLGNKGADAPESDHAVLQWGADYAAPSGWYAGYWGSQINYSYKQLGDSYNNRSITNFQKDKSIENDLYGGYAGKYRDFTYTLGLTGYVYYNGSHANALETKIGAGYGPFGVNAQTLLNDVVWGNKGDTYWTATYTATLPYEINFTGSLGYYTYKKEGKFLGTRDTALGVNCGPGESFVVNGCFAGNRPSSGGFRHLILGATKAIGDTGVVVGLQALIAGENRFAVQQDNRLIGTLSYTF